jgi:LAGLIDADG endonuclease/NADH-Ubiquinone oxidoreductase (complex I), chain 5 N-terminus/Proton-conducting membrane transporter
MYLTLIVLPLLGSIASGFFGRKIGVSGSHLITCSSVLLTTVLAIIAFFEVGFNNIPVTINIARWIDVESLNVLWSFKFDSLTISMLLPVLIVSSLVHIYSIGYMNHDPHNQRFFSYLSLFTFMMIILVTGNNYLLMFVGWEGVGICSYLLVNFWFTRIAANQSSMSAFLTNRVGDCFLTIGIFIILWSFGKKNILNYIKNNKNYSQNRLIHNKSSSKLAPYLAGLIEGDGYIAVHDKNSKSKVFRPKIIIVFNRNDKPLAIKLSNVLKVGKVIDKPKAGHVLLQVLAKEEVLKIINLINGYMRTPKIEALHRAINWINEKDNTNILLLGLDLSPLDSNSWLSGFSDADANFSITVYDRKKKEKVVRTNVQTFFRIEVKQNYTRDVTVDSYFTILTKIAEFFTVNLYTRTRYKDDKIYYAFMVIAHNSKSHKIVREYFENYPLYSSKYLSYKDWCKIQDIHKGKNLSKEDLLKIKEIKSQFNNKRINFDFSHLSNLTL